MVRYRVQSTGYKRHLFLSRPERVQTGAYIAINLIDDTEDSAFIARWGVSFLARAPIDYLSLSLCLFKRVASVREGLKKRHSRNFLGKNTRFQLTRQDLA